MSITSMVLGIVSLFLGGWIGLLVGVLALIFGIVTLCNGTGKKGFSIAGISCSGVSMVWNILVIIGVITLRMF